MTYNIFLHELRRSKRIVDITLLKNNDLLIVEPEQIKKGIYSVDLEYEDMQVFKTVGYTVAAHLCWDPLGNKEFIILLKDCGILEVLDSQLERIDLLETEFQIAHDDIFILFDDRNNRIYINLTINGIYAIDYQLEGDRLSFVKRNEHPQCIFESVKTISNMESSWHVDYDSGRDFNALSILLYNENSNQFSFQVIRQLQVESRKRKQTWEILINETLLELKESSMIYKNKNPRFATSKAVPNIGFFVFSFSGIFLFELPGGSENLLEGKKVVGYGTVEGLLSISELDSFGSEIELQANVLLTQKLSGLEFTIASTGNLILVVSLDLIFEETMEQIYHWKRSVTRKHAIEELLLPNGDMDEVVKSIYLKHPLCILVSHSRGLLVVDLDIFKVVHKLTYKLRSAFYSDFIGNDFRKHIICGGTRENEGFVESSFFGYQNFLSLDKQYTSSKDITRVWSTERSLWWRNDGGELFCNGKFVAAASEVVHITQKDVLLKDSFINSAVNIWGDRDGNYAYITTTGIIRWSDEEEGVKIGKFKNSSLAKYVLACTRQIDGSKLTVIAVDNEFTILRNTQISKESIRISHELEAISSLFIIASKSSHHLLVGGINGVVCVLDLATLKVYERRKIGSEKIHICGIPQSDYVLIYTKDEIILVATGTAGKYEMTKISIPHRITHINARDKLNIDILVDRKDIYICGIPSEIEGPSVITKQISTNTHFHTKFISLPCSTRYVITSSFHSEYSDAHKRTMYSTEVQLHDIELQKTVYQYDLSKRYPHAIISDIAAIPFKYSIYSKDYDKRETSYAKQLTLGKCFVVALDYEAAEEDSLDNLLLFSLDNDSGTLDFQLGTNTGHPITALHNYYSHLFLLAGEVLQAFQIDYSVKDNAFKIEPVSNKLYICGFVRCITSLSPNQSNLNNPKRRKLDKTEFANHRIIILNIFKGLQEFTLSRKGPAQRSIPSERYYLTPVTNSHKEISFIRNIAPHMVTSISMCRSSKKLWFAVCSSNGVVSLHCLCAEEEDFSLEFKLPSQVISITPLGQKYKGGNLMATNSLFKDEEQTLSGLFNLSTCQGGCYTLGVINDANLLRKFEKSTEMDEQLKFIGMVAEEGNFVDGRIVVDGDGMCSFTKYLF